MAADCRIVLYQGQGPGRPAAARRPGKRAPCGRHAARRSSTYRQRLRPQAVGVGDGGRPVAILINFSGPHGPDSFRNATIRALKRLRMSLKTPPDKWVHRLRKQSMATPGPSVPFRGGHDARGWVVAIRWHGLAHYRRRRPGHGVSWPSPRCLVARLVHPGTFRPDLTQLRHARRPASRSALLGRGLLGLVVFGAASCLRYLRWSHTPDSDGDHEG